MSISDEVRAVPNGGWDQRILVFQYKRVVSAFVVISERYAILLDTLVSPATAGVMLAAAADALRAGRQLLVINTHADWDHYWGNGLFGGAAARHPAPIVGHRLCRERVLAPETQARLVEMREQEPQTFADVSLVAPALAFDGALTIDGGDLTFELMHTPGHTPDHVAVYVPEIRTLFAGDAAEDPLPFVRDAASLVQLRASLERMLALDPAVVLACHAPDTHSPALLRDNAAYFAEVERRATQAITAGQVAAVLDAASDVEALIAFPFADVAHTSALDAETQAFYRDGHQAAIRATLEGLRLRMGQESQ